MSLLLDALNRAQRNKSSEDNSDEEQKNDELQDSADESLAVDLEGLELNKADKEEISDLATESSHDNEIKSELSTQELNTEVASEKINNDEPVGGLEKPILELESEDKPKTFDLEGLNLGELESKPEEKQEVTQEGRLGELSLTEVPIEESIEFVAPAELIENNDVPPTLETDNDFEKKLLEVKKGTEIPEPIIASPERATGIDESEKSSAESLNKIAPNKFETDENIGSKKNDNKIENTGDRDNSIKKLLETKKRKKLITSVVSAILASFTISLSGYYYYAGQISDIDKVVDQYAGRTLTPIGAIPSEEIKQGNPFESEVTNSANEKFAQTIVPKVTKLNSSDKEEIIISEKSAELFREKQLNTKRTAPIVRKKVRKTTKPKRVLKKTARKNQAKESPVHLLLISAFDEFQLGNDDVASSKYFSVLELEKDNRDALLGLGAIAVRQKKFETARNYYTQILKRNQSDSIARAALVGLVGQLDPIKAETELKLMLKNEPGAGYLHFALGNTYALQQRWLEAQKAFLNAYRIEGNNADYAYNIAVSYDHLGESLSAIKFYEHALDYSENKKVSFQSIQVKRRIDSLKNISLREN